MATWLVAALIHVDAATPSAMGSCSPRVVCAEYESSSRGQESCRVRSSHEGRGDIEDHLERWIGVTVREVSHQVHSLFSLVDGWLGSLSTAPVPVSSRGFPRSIGHPALLSASRSQSPVNPTRRGGLLRR